MTRTSRNLIFVLLLKLTLVASGSAAEPKPASGQEWDALVRKAEDEGEVAIYATDSIGNAQTIWAAFQKRYPKIKLLGTSVGRGSDLFPKLFSERRAGKYLADVFLAGPTAVHLNLYPAKILEPMPPALVHPNVTDLSKWWQGKHHYVDPEGQYNFMYESALYGPPLSLNTSIVTEKEIKSAWDLVQPQWKGKYAVLQLNATQGSTALSYVYHHPQLPRFERGNDQPEPGGGINRPGLKLLPQFGHGGRCHGEYPIPVPFVRCRLCLPFLHCRGLPIRVRPG